MRIMTCFDGKFTKIVSVFSWKLISIFTFVELCDPFTILNRKDSTALLHVVQEDIGTSLRICAVGHVRSSSRQTDGLIYSVHLELSLWTSTLYRS